MEDKTTKISRPLPPDDETKISRPPEAMAAEKEQTNPDNEYAKFMAVLHLVQKLRGGVESFVDKGQLTPDIISKIDELRGAITAKIQELGILDEKHSLNQPQTVPLEESLDRMKKLSGIK